MIRFPRGHWTLIFWWWGGVIRHLIKPASVYLAFLITSYALASTVQYRLVADERNLHLLGGFVSFLLVFRLNQCMARYAAGKTFSAQLFTDCEGLIGIVCTYLKGADKNAFGIGDDTLPFDHAILQRHGECAIVSKLNVIRLTIALMVGFHIHCRLLEAVADCGGMLQDDTLSQVLFSYVRLQGLLYAEEMKLIDKALSISCISSLPGSWLFNKHEKDTQYYVDVNCYRLNSDTPGQPLIGVQNANENSRSTTALPKVIMGLLRDALLQPLEEPWGYPQRMLNLFEPCCRRMMLNIENLSRLVAIPLPMAYLQHCRFLLLVFALCHPLNIDTDEGFCANVVMPFFIFWALMGFEILAEAMENPIGDDDVDLNILEMIHSLEVATQHIFDLTEVDRSATRKALQRPLWDFSMSAKVHSPVPWEKYEETRKKFTQYFVWVPMPTKVLEQMVRNHGHVCTVHQTLLHQDNTRELLRRSFSRRTVGQYRPVGSSENSVFHAADSPGSPSRQRDRARELSALDRAVEKAMDSARRGLWWQSSEEALQQDPTIWCHYLSLSAGPQSQTSATVSRRQADVDREDSMPSRPPRACEDPETSGRHADDPGLGGDAEHLNSEDVVQQAEWARRTGEVLHRQGSSAASLFKKVEFCDSARSLLGAVDDRKDNRTL